MSSCSAAAVSPCAPDRTEDKRGASCRWVDLYGLKYSHLAIIDRSIVLLFRPVGSNVSLVRRRALCIFER